MALVQFTGIEKAFERVLISGADPRSLVAQKIRVRDAAPLLKMMEVAAGAAARDGQGAWDLVNCKHVQAMANAAEMVKVVEVVILPELHRHPTSGRHLDALALFGRSLKEEAPKAGGTFEVMMVAAAASIDNFITEARAQPPTPYVVLRATIDELTRHLRSVADKSCTLRQTGTGPAAAAPN